MTALARAALRLLAPAALALALGAGSFFSEVALVDAAAPRAELRVAPGLFCAVGGDGTNLEAADCFEAEVENGVLSAHSDDGEVVEADLLRLGGDLVLLVAAAPEEGLPDYVAVPALLTENAFVALDLDPILSGADLIALADAHNVSLTPPDMSLSGPHTPVITAGAPEDARRLISTVVARRLAALQNDPAAIETALLRTRYAVRAAEAGAAADADDIAARAAAARAALRDAILTFAPNE